MGHLFFQVQIRLTPHGHGQLATCCFDFGAISRPHRFFCASGHYFGFKKCVENIVVLIRDKKGTRAAYFRVRPGPTRCSSDPIIKAYCCHAPDSLLCGDQCTNSPVMLAITFRFSTHSKAMRPWLSSSVLSSFYCVADGQEIYGRCPKESDAREDGTDL